MAKTDTNVPKKNNAKREIEWAPGMPFGKINYILMLIGIAVLFIGYILLSGGGTDDSSQFNSTQKKDAKVCWKACRIPCRP